MRKMTFVKGLVLLTLIAVGVGFYQGWFIVASPSRDSNGEKVNVGLTIDKGKFKEDAENVKDKTKELADKASEGAKSLGGKARDAVKPATKTNDAP